MNQETLRVHRKLDEALTVIREVENLIAPGSIDIAYLLAKEVSRIEKARELLSKVTGTKYP